MSLLFDNQEFIINKIRAVEYKYNSSRIMGIEFMEPEAKYKEWSILLEVYDLTTEFIQAIEDEFQCRIFNIFGTNKWTTQIFINRCPILRLLD